MPVVDIPEVTTRVPQVKGIFVGGCVERGDGSSFRAKAHTHWAGEYTNWICVRSVKRLYTASGKPSPLMWHEAAHAIVGKQGHTQKWADVARSLGARIPKGRYRHVN